MPTEWYYAKDGQQFGPITDDKMNGIIDQGKIGPADLVWCEGMEEWAPAGDVFVSLGEADAPPVQKTGGAARSNESGPAGYLDLHPLLAILLAICSCGLFALWYTFQVSSSYTRRTTTAVVDLKGRQLGKLRHPVGVLALCYFTFGIYFAYWTYAAMKECGIFLGRRDIRPRTELTLMLMFPPYVVYVVVFRLAELVRRVQSEAKVSETPLLSHVYVFLNPCLFLGLPYLAMLYQDALDEAWIAAAMTARKQT